MLKQIKYKWIESISLLSYLYEMKKNEKIL